MRLPKSSLLSRYLLIVVAALFFVPVIFPLSIMAYGFFTSMTVPKDPADYALYTKVTELEQMWHEEALLLQGRSAEEIDERLQELSRKYTRASMFWVDHEGKTRLLLEPVAPVPGASAASRPVIPERWTAVDAISFMKSTIGNDPLGIVAFIGDREEAGEGFMVMQVSRLVISSPTVEILNLWFILVLLVFFVGFAIVSWLFFIGIRKRLLRLQRAMTVTGPAGMPRPIPYGKPDEIGRLEEAFNTMVGELAESRRREAEEEELRKRLVADLSHDLRTPLTVIRSHVHHMTKENLTMQGRESLQLMDERISDLGTLIDNLLSYNLLHSGRITLELKRKDVLRLLRESAAAWYPLWEKEGFAVEIDLDAEPLYWMVDEVWFRRVLDNLYQNIIRHARSGRYVGISAGIRQERRVIMIADHGKGIGSRSEAKGAGLGLSIVDLLLKHMELEWNAESSDEGTVIIISHARQKI
ncbi:hypothetical protein GCM10010912_07560 [Paenibacillus albidus]|uniref:histidine kinase n=1 Tax=Paenibacillus albidus TaxID=2041023 RepID=A0A917FCJ7_9BACL|nr:HAMP domain-containing sensor histidine kinase [Paenibacillus albidus]GGF65048.1 hypothetical protein GCM10010912_07560 [Paenibacillus albidus]